MALRPSSISCSRSRPSLHCTGVVVFVIFFCLVSGISLWGCVGQRLYGKQNKGTFRLDPGVLVVHLSNRRKAEVCRNSSPKVVPKTWAFGGFAGSTSPSCG